MKSEGATLNQLADAVRDQAVRIGSSTPAVRGANWRMATVATVNADGTVITDDGITARRLVSYSNPAVGDLIVIHQSSGGNWYTDGPMSAGTFPLGHIETRRKPSSTSRASTTTLAADPHLSIDVVPGTYKVDALIMYDADAAADLKLGWFAPASTTGGWWPGGSDSGNTTFAATTRWGALADFSVSTLPVAGVGAGSIVSCRPTGTAVVTATGQISLAWAQNVSNAIATIVRGHSWLELRRIA